MGDDSELRRSSSGLTLLYCSLAWPGETRPEGVRTFSPACLLRDLAWTSQGRAGQGGGREIDLLAPSPEPAVCSPAAQSQRAQSIQAACLDRVGEKMGNGISECHRQLAWPALRIKKGGGERLSTSWLTRDGGGSSGDGMGWDQGRWDR